MLSNDEEKYREEGRQEVWNLFVEKFEELHDQYYAQGDSVACDLVTDLIAWLQDDWDGISAKHNFQ
jgi:hypothetical protein